MSERERQLLMLSRMEIGPVWMARRQPLAETVLAQETAAPEKSAESFESVESDERQEVDAWSDIADIAPPQAMPAAQLFPNTVVSAAGQDWPQLQQTVAACTACGLCQGRNRTVFGVGDRKASWLFVGEGPGRQEDLKGEPFIGPAGKLLDNMLKALGMNRETDAYIANVVKCRPTADDGRDRPPTPEEITSCLPFLQQQVELIQPDVIVALGRIAAISLLGLPHDTPVSSLRGKLHQFQGKPMIVTYHPAYLLRQPTDKAKVWRDLCMARAAHATRG